MSAQCSECCSFDLGCLSNPLPAEDEAHHLCSWLENCSNRHISQFCCDYAHQIAMLAVLSKYQVNGHLYLRILKTLFHEMVTVRAITAPEGCDARALTAASSALVDITCGSLRNLPVDFAATLLKAVQAACTLPILQSCLHQNMSVPAQGAQGCANRVTQSSQPTVSCYKKLKVTGDAHRMCARCHMVAVAIEHLSSKHTVLARASYDLLKAMIASFSSWRPALEALQHRAVHESLQQLPEDGLPAGIQRTVRGSIADSNLLRLFCCIQAMVSSQGDLVTENCNYRAVLEALHLSQLVLQKPRSRAHEFKASTGACVSSLENLVAPGESMYSWTSLFSQGLQFHPSQSLRRGAVGLMKAVVGNPVVWGYRHAMGPKEGSSCKDAVERGDQMAIRETGGHGVRGHTGGEATHCMTSMDSAPHSVHREAAVGSVTCKDHVAPVNRDSTVSEGAIAVLRLIQTAAEEPELQASAMHCAAAALRGGGVADELGSQLIQAGAAAVQSDLQAASSESAEMPDVAGTTSSCGGHDAAPAEAFTSAAADWLCARPASRLSCPPLQEAVDVLRQRVIWPALAVLARSERQKEHACPGEAGVVQSCVASADVGKTVVILRSASRFPALCAGRPGSFDRHVREAAEKCVVNVAAALAQLPLGHVATAVYVQATVCLLDIADSIDEHGRCQQLSTAGLTKDPDPLRDKAAPSVWEWLAMMCLDELLTSSHMASSLHVLSPILHRIIQVQCRPQRCRSEVSQLLASRMVLLHNLDSQFSRRVILDESLGHQRGADAVLVEQAVVSDTATDDQTAPTEVSHVSVSKVAWVLNDSAACVQSKDVIVTGDVADHRHCGSLAPDAGLLDTAERSGVSGTVMMHVKEMLSIYRPSDTGLMISCNDPV